MDVKYFIYCRKSSESEDKQILSLPAQVRELKDFAFKNNFKVTRIFEEEKSAHRIGRPIFNEMIQRIENEEANGIIAWDESRLARNSLDGGKIIYMMDLGQIVEIVKPPLKMYRNTPDDKSWLNFVFTMSKKESDDKSVNVKRGNREKFLEERVWIGPAKSGYLNSIDLTTKKKIIIEDKVRLPLIEKAIKMLLTGSYTPMEVLYKLNHDWGYKTKPFKRKDKSKQKDPQPLSKSGFYKILNDPYYWGLMIRREGEVMGTHKAIMTKDEFERIQVMLGDKGRHTSQKYEFPYKGVLKCGECGASITAEHKWQIICPTCKTKFNRGKSTIQCHSCKTYIDQMKGYKLLHYIYYHCTKKAHPDCSQGCMTLEKIEEQIRNEIERFEISESFKNWAIAHLNELNDSEVVDRESIRESQQRQYNDCIQRIDNLVKLRISSNNSAGEQISEEEYIAKRKSLMAESRIVSGWFYTSFAQSEKNFAAFCMLLLAIRGLLLVAVETRKRLTVCRFQ